MLYGLVLDCQSSQPYVSHGCSARCHEVPAALPHGWTGRLPLAWLACVRTTGPPPRTAESASPAPIRRPYHPPAPRFRRLQPDEDRSLATCNILVMEYCDKVRGYGDIEGRRVPEGGVKHEVHSLSVQLMVLVMS